MNKLQKDLRDIKLILSGQSIKRRPQNYTNTKEYNREYMRLNRVCTVVDGKMVSLAVTNKRERPSKCELCGRTYRRLNYHHWDPKNLAFGMWLCYPCHLFANAMENTPGIAQIYLKLKSLIENQQQ